MKKLLTILALGAIFSTTLFAKSAQVQLNTSIEETEVSYELAYGKAVLEDGIETYAINIDAPLTEAGKTDPFTVYASSNKNKDMSVSVKVSPESFKTTLNNGNDNFDSGITPQVNTINNVSTVPAGLQKDLLVNKFNMSWTGNKELPAGKYTSDVSTFDKGVKRVNESVLSNLDISNDDIVAMIDELLNVTSTNTDETRKNRPAYSNEYTQRVSVRTYSSLTEAIAELREAMALKKASKRDS